MTVVVEQGRPFRDIFFRLRKMVKDNKWRRDHIELDGQFCMLGMVGVACNDGPHDFTRGKGAILVDLLDRAIPDDELDELKRIHTEHRHYAKVNGGTIRGFTSAAQRVATYNNTRPGEAEIEEWVDRALALSMS